jgi:hypothetical protein
MKILKELKKEKEYYTKGRWYGKKYVPPLA